MIGMDRVNCWLIRARQLHRTRSFSVNSSTRILHVILIKRSHTSKRLSGVLPHPQTASQTRPKPNLGIRIGPASTHDQPESIKAWVVDGILTVTFPKRSPGSEPKEI